MRCLKLALLSAGLALTLVGPAMAQTAATVKVTDDPKLGKILTDDKGMTLYRYRRDTPNVSTCYDACATRWPPLLAGASGQPAAAAGIPGTWGVTSRTDGTKQVTYNAMPLYYFQQDAKAGDTNGQGVGTVWYIVEPATAAPAEAFGAPPAAPAPAASPAAAAAGPAAQLPRTGELPLDPSVLALGAALAALGFGLRGRFRR